MPADYYSDGPDSVAGETSAKTDTPEQAKERAEEAEGKTALIDSDICPGMKAGDEMVLTIEKVTDNGQYLVSYAPPEGGEKEEAEESPEEEAAEREEGMGPMRRRGRMGMGGDNPGSNYY